MVLLISHLLRGAGFSVWSVFEADAMLVVEAALGFAGSVSSMTIILPSTLLSSREIRILFITQLLRLDNVKQFPGKR